MQKLPVLAKFSYHRIEFNFGQAPQRRENRWHRNCIIQHGVEIASRSLKQDLREDVMQALKEAFDE